MLSDDKHVGIPMVLLAEKNVILFLLTQFIYNKTVLDPMIPLFPTLSILAFSPSN